MEFETVIGLEIHAQLKTKTKIFCGCSNEFGAAPNTHTCPICLGMPGVLPVLNRKVVEFAIRFGLATGSKINQFNQFARKNYFYPDLPKGYQTSQFDKPIVGKGFLDIEVDGEIRRIGITRAHMEEDAGKLVHDSVEPVSHVDLNRTGTPLLEIVSEPDMRSPQEAVAYLKKLHAIVRYLNICDGNMQEGSFRCDANISLRPVGQKELGTRTELKNMNSFRHVEAALEYEQRRQRDLLLDGGKIVQETLLWDPDKQVSASMRGKEDAHDYRYFPCPDLVPVEISDEWIEEVRAGLPELPDARKARFMSEYELSEYDAGWLTGDRPVADYFEAVVKGGAQAKRAANWIMSELSRELGSEDIESCRVSPGGLAELLAMIEKNTISGKIAKSVFVEMMESGKDAVTIVKEKGLEQNSDAGELQAVIEKIVAANPEQAEEFRSGKAKMMGYFVGQLMKETKGKANPKMANELFAKVINKG
ncbi:MAG: Asp-tRNA(Asn)/Glu-tRNA(Gln) amidotransferase subunit GatB [Desulforhopalus sp.]|nr:Asp-tRNA(Asn)/Glu-tRNA(Gln) amidotransferase subunit GatB [Desulforhopalus sp.]